MATRSDQDLWKAYGVELKKQLLGSIGLGEKDRIYLAPISAAGIAAGGKVPAAVTNMGIYDVGNALLDPTSPIFNPTSAGLFDRCKS